MGLEAGDGVGHVVVRGRAVGRAWKAPSPGATLPVGGRRALVIWVAISPRHPCKGGAAGWGPTRNNNGARGID
eukprot:6345139-Alexandrium_andersonii.AAC.1